MLSSSLLEALKFHPSRKEIWSVQGFLIYKFFKKYEPTGLILSSGKPLKVTAEIKQLVEEQMSADDETTSYWLHHPS